MVSSNDSWLYDSSETASSVVGVEVAAGSSTDLDGDTLLYLRKSGGRPTDYLAVQSSGTLTLHSSSFTGFDTAVDQLAGGEVCDDGNSFIGNGTAMQIDGGTATIGDAVVTAPPGGGGGNTFTDNVTAIDVNNDGALDMAFNTITGTDGQTGVIDNSTASFSSTNDTIGGTNGHDMLGGFSIKKSTDQASPNLFQKITGDVMSFADTDIDDDGGDLTVAGSSFTGVSLGNDVYAGTGMVVEGGGSLSLAGGNRALSA